MTWLSLLSTECIVALQLLDELVVEKHGQLNVTVKGKWRRLFLSTKAVLLMHKYVQVFCLVWMMKCYIIQLNDACDLVRWLYGGKAILQLHYDLLTSTWRQGLYPEYFGPIFIMEGSGDEMCNLFVAMLYKS